MATFDCKGMPVRLNKCALVHLLPALETWLPLEAQESVRIRRQALCKLVAKCWSEACNQQQAAASWHAESERIRSALAHPKQQVQEPYANHGTPLPSTCLVMTAWSLQQLVQSVFSCVFRRTNMSLMQLSTSTRLTVYNSESSQQLPACLVQRHGQLDRGSMFVACWLELHWHV